MDPYLNKIIGKKYRISRKLGEGLTSTVYLARYVYKSSTLAAIKILKSKSISHRTEDIIRFHTEAEIITSLSHPRIIRLYELIEENNLICIIMEYFKGISLREIIERNGKLKMKQIVNIIHSLCCALHYIHNKEIIHRDLKPGNILIAEKRGGIDYKNLKIIDFGLSLIKGPENIDDVHILIGTCGYIAPEQTGLSGHKGDERSDLYSLGIIFYELLTHRLPFSGKTISTLIHQHIAKKPVPPSHYNQDIPGVIDRIILKLLEKEPEKRYQCAQGLLKDLEKIQNGVMDFTPGLEDRHIKLNFQTPFVGREKELSYLKELADKSLRGQGSICFIKGEPGIGKSRIVDELRNYMYNKKGILIKGKSFPGIKNSPYSLFKDVLNNYIKLFRYYTKIEKMGIREKLKESLGELGMIILKVNPGMKQITGDFPSLVQLNPEREKQRFIHVVSRFFLHLAQFECGMIMCLDDLQWSDETSMEIVIEIAKNITDYPLFLTGTYRPRELLSNYHLHHFIKNRTQNSHTFTMITLNALSKKKIKDFVSQILFTRQEAIQPICDIVFQKSGGNPFFIIEILKQMLDERIIVYKDTCWYIDQVSLEKTGLSSTIIEILLKRISLLKKTDILLLSYAALLGREFHIDFLFTLSGNLTGLGEEKNKKIVEILEKAKRLQLIEEEPGDRRTYRFCHDRIQEAFYKKIKREEKKELHNKIGITLEENNKTGSPDMTYQIACHFIEAENSRKILEYAYPASLFAKENYAYDDAVRYLKIYKQNLEKNGMEETELWIDCIITLGEIYLITGKNDEALSLYERILPIIDGKIKKARIYMHISQAYFKKWDRVKCVYFARQGLKLLGEPLPSRNPRVWIDIIIEAAKHVVHMLLPWIFIRKKKPVNYEKYSLIIWFYYSLCWLYVLIDTPKFIRSTLRGINICTRKIGISKEYGMYLGGVGSAIMSIPFFKLSFRYLSKALEIKRKLNDKWGEGQILFFFGCYYQWKGDYLQSKKYFKKSLTIMKRVGDIKEMAFTIDSLSMNYRYMSLYEDSLAYNQDYYKAGKDAHDDYAISGSISRRLMIFFEKGDYKELGKWLKEIENYTLEEKYDLANIDKHTYSGYLSLHKENIKEAISYFEKGKEIFEHSHLLMQYSCYVYTHLSEVYLIYYNNMKQTKNNVDKRNIRKKIFKYCRLALKNTRNWITFYGGALRVNAMYMALLNRDKKAERLFLRSINLNKKLRRKYELGLGYYEYGIFLNNKNKNKEARENWEKAYRLFIDMDSKDYLMRTGRLLGLEDEDDIFKRITRQLKDKQMISISKKWTGIMNSAIDKDKMLDQTLDLALEITGAQRGILFKADEDNGDLDIMVTKPFSWEDIIDDTISITLAYKAYKTKKIIITSDALENKIYRQNESIIKAGIKFLLCLPVIYKTHIKGVCYVDNPLSGIVLTKDRIDLLNSIMTLAFITYEHSVLAEKYKKVKIDKEKVEEICISFDLTKREREIICMLIKTMTNREICNAICVSLSTLRTHLNHIYHKTKAGSREELIELFMKKV